MKATLTTLSALVLFALASPAKAHHETPDANAVYGVFWKGLAPRPLASMQGPGNQARTAPAREIWRHAFVSHYRLVGADFSALALP